MDALSAVLAPVRLQRTRWAFTAGRAPWGLSVPATKCCIRFHYLLHGNAWLSLDKERVALSGGELAVMPRGHAHTLRDHPRSPTERFEDVATTYGIATNDFVANGGEGSPNFSGRFTSQEIMDQVVADYVAANSPLSPIVRAAPNGRVNCADSNGDTAPNCPTLIPSL